MRKILGIIAAVAILVGCYGPPTGEVSSNGYGYTAHYDRDFQLDKGLPVIWIDYLCEGLSSSWIAGPSQSITPSSPATVSIAVSCYPRKLLQGVPRSKES